MKLFIALYLIALALYFYTRTSNNKTYRMINKYVMATMYLVYALKVFFNQYVFVSYETMLMVALVLTYLGDIFLVLDFSRGGDFFLAANICYVIYEQMVMADFKIGFDKFLWTYIVVAILLVIFMIATNHKIDMGNMKWPMTLYVATIFMHGITGLCLAINMANTNYMIMGIGSFLFMISDIVLILYKFVFNNNKWLIRLNSLTYFVGILLIVIAMAL